MFFHRVFFVLKAIYYSVMAVAMVMVGAYTVHQFVKYDDQRREKESHYRSLAGGVIAYGARIHDTIEKMMFTYRDTMTLQFRDPDRLNRRLGDIAEYNVFHPAGGGVILFNTPKSDVSDTVKNGVKPGWYIGRFNDVNWTFGQWGNGEDNNDDIIITSYKVSRDLCEQINLLTVNTRHIPVVQADLSRLLISGTNQNFNDKHHRNGNMDFNAGLCRDCNGRRAMCVKQADADIYAYFMIVAVQ